MRPKITDVYFSADVETDGSIPGPYSMLSFGIVVAGRFDGHRFERPARLDETFEAELRPISSEFQPEALRVNGLDRDRLVREGSDPVETMTKAAAWIRERAGGGTPVLVAYPLSFDWTWLYWYFERFAKGGSPFKHSRCFDLKTAFSVKSGRPLSSSGRDALPAELRSKRPHTHRAIDDAIEQAEIFANVFEWKPLTLPIFEERRATTQIALDGFREKLVAHLGSDLATVIGAHTTVYVTGSGGRGEMSKASDLDLFLVRSTGQPSKLHAPVLQAAIIRATSDAGIVPPSSDGVFLEMHSADDFEGMLGSQEDDAKNKFTARMLLLLESRPVLAEDVYEQIVTRMIDRYWSTGADHPESYLPYVFVNDVIRYWRVVLLNHEARLTVKRKELSEEKPTLSAEELERRMKVERYVRSFKLRFARCLTCFASLAYLLAWTNGKKHVSKEDMRVMVRLTPLERIRASGEMGASAEVNKVVASMEELYAGFLDESAYPKKGMLDRFSNLDFARTQAHKGSEFADLMFELLKELGMRAGGEPNPLFRYMLV